MIFEDSLTIVDDFLRILERVLRYFGDISRLYQVVPEPNSKLHFLSRSSRPKLKITIIPGNHFLKTRFFKNHRDLSHELRNGRLDKLVPIFIKIGHQKADLFLAGNLGFRVQPETCSGRTRKLPLGPGGRFRHNSLFVRKTLPRGHLPPRVFLPRSCSSFPPRR